MMRDIHILSGPPASGKSYWMGLTHEWNAVLLSRDDFRDNLRSILHSYEYFPVKESTESYLWTQYVSNRIYVGNDIDIYLDATHIGLKSLQKTYEIIKPHLVNLKGQIYLDRFEVPFEVLIQRDREREGRRQVGLSVIAQMFERHYDAINEEYLKFLEEHNIILVNH